MHVDVDVDAEVITERPGRTFAVIELAVRSEMRGLGITRELHTHLLAAWPNNGQPRSFDPMLAQPARRTFSWAYGSAGLPQPSWTAGYEGMIKELRAADRVHLS